MVVALTFADLLKRLRTDRQLTQEQLALVVDLTKNTIALLETTERIPHANNARNLLLALAAETPLDDDDCAHWLEVTGMSSRSRDGVLDETDRQRMLDLGVVVAADADPRERANRPAFASYGPKIARVRGVGVGDVFEHRARQARDATGYAIARELFDRIADRGQIMRLVSLLSAHLSELDGEAAERSAANEALERASPPTLVPDKHTAYPAEGRVVTEYSPGDPAPTPQAHVPPRPKARRKSG